MQSEQNAVFHGRQKTHFSRLFPELSPLMVTDDQLWTLACQMTEDAKDAHDSRVITNGLSIFSQFLAHDMTFESTSKFQGINEPGTFQNDRTINLDLDCVYGQRTQDFFYDSQDTDKLLLGKYFENEHGAWYDVQRNSQGKAIIPDARNDENIIVSRMQVLFIEFHNKIVDHLRAKGVRGSLFERARKLVVWHYQWLILHEYLHRMMDWDIYDRMLSEGCQYYRHPWTLPLEFTGAAFRTGHSQTREMNRINEHTDKQLFELGFFNEMEDYVDWRYIFNFGDDRCQFARLIDTRIGQVFHDIPFIKSKDERERSLPFRNLKRGVIYGLPSGEDVAHRMGFEPIEVPETEKMQLAGTPLWHYILKEAEVLGHKGEHLGPVGSTILGECFYTVMLHDDYSFFKLQPRWKPSLGKDIGDFEFTDLVRFVRKREKVASPVHQQKTKKKTSTDVAE